MTSWLRKTEMEPGFWAPHDRLAPPQQALGGPEIRWERDISPWAELPTVQLIFHGVLDGVRGTLMHSKQEKAGRLGPAVPLGWTTRRLGVWASQDGPGR